MNGPAEMLNIRSRNAEEITVLDFEGDFDLNAQGPVSSVLGRKASDADGPVIWNFNDVASITGGGIGILINAFKEMGGLGRVAKLVNVRPSVVDVLQVHKVLPAFDIHTDEAAAAKQIRIEMEKKGEAIKRLFDRINIDLKARFKRFREGREAVDCKVCNAEAKSLSRCGIFLCTNELYPRDTVLQVYLELPTGLFKPQVKFLGKVVWVTETRNKDGMGPGMAMSIVSLAPEERTKLEEFLEGHGV